MEKRIRSVEKTRGAGWLLLAMLMATVVGCGGTTTVSGKVTYQGRPVVFGSVIFQSSDKTARSGVIAPDGSFTVAGIHPGAARIAVISRDPSKGRSASRSQKPDAPNQPGAAVQESPLSGWFLLPGKFESPRTSGLECQLTAGHVTNDINLE